MQGRLSPPENGLFQAFPCKSWESELRVAREATVEGVEWIHDSHGVEVNPLLTPDGRCRMQELASEAGVVIASLCADWFMEQPLGRDPTRVANLREVVAAAAAAGIARVVLPCVDDARLRDGSEERALVQAVAACTPTLERENVELHLETDLPPQRFRSLLEAIGHPLVRANYDTGNSASLGYDPHEEWEAYGGHVGSVHVKDRRLGAGTVPLGTGDAGLATVFEIMRELAWSRPLVLQVARGPAGEEVGWVARAAGYVRNLWRGGGVPST